MSEKKDLNQEGLPGWLLRWKNIILLVIGVFTAWNTYTSNVTTNELKIKADKQEQALRQQEFDNQVRFKVFEEVKRAVDSKNRALQEAVIVIVDEMLASDTVFKEKMRTILLASHSVDNAVKSDVLAVQAFEDGESVPLQRVPVSSETTGSRGPASVGSSNEETTTAAPALADTSLRIDVFYLEDLESEAEPLAQRVAGVLSERYKHVRLRLLPTAVNARKGYRVDHNQLRYEDAELKVAQEVLRLVNGTGVFTNEDMVLREVSNKTPNYISVFIRNL